MSNDESVEYLKARIWELEEEVVDREKDLSLFRQELADANKKLEAMIGDLSRDLKLAHQIQRSLLPTELPNIPGFEFSSKFVASTIQGGDYFDIFEHEDRARFGTVMATSAGPGMAALLLSVLLKLTGQMEARRGAEPRVVLANIAKEILDSAQTGQSADLFYSMFDRRNYELSYCLAGEVSAVVQSYADGELKRLSETSKPLQLGFDLDAIKGEVTTLNPRDRLVLCTRGITEALSLDGEAFGRERLYKTILEAPRRGVHELRNQVLFEIQRFTGGVEPKRDQTVVVCEVKDRVIKLAKR